MMVLFTKEQPSMRMPTPSDTETAPPVGPFPRLAEMIWLPSKMHRMRRRCESSIRTDPPELELLPPVKPMLMAVKLLPEVKVKCRLFAAATRVRGRERGEASSTSLVEKMYSRVRRSLSGAPVSAKMMVPLHCRPDHTVSSWFSRVAFVLTVCGDVKPDDWHVTACRACRGRHYLK
jgi:hypothetical protein